MGLIILLLSIPFGVLVMAYSLLLTTLLSTFINAFPNKSLMSYTYIEQIKDMMPSLVLSIGMCIIIYPLKFIIHSNLVLMVIQILLGAVVYIILSYLFKIDSFMYIYRICKSKIQFRKL